MRSLLLLISFILAISSCSSYQKTSSISEETLNYIKTESVNDKLDFEKQLDQHQLYVADGIAYNYKEMAIYTWGSAVCKLGIKVQVRLLLCMKK